MESKSRHKGQKNNSEALILLKTFLATFLIIMVVATPIFALGNRVLDITPGDPDAPTLQEEVDFSELISTDNPFFDAFMNTNRVNILLIGVDNHNLTDTIMLASFDVDNRFLDVISIPRDTYFFRGPGFSDAHHKINAVFRGNPVNTAMAVSQVLMNIPINYYIQVSYEGVANIIDQIGGVPMRIERPMRYRDPFDTPPLVIDIPAGDPVLLDGETSVLFLRYRAFPDEDLGRIRRQQAFLQSAARQSIGPNLPRIVESAFENITSDISLRTAIHLATRAVGMDLENVRTHSLPYRSAGTFVHPDVDGIAEMLREIYSMEPDPIDEEFEEDEESYENSNS